MRKILLNDSDFDLFDQDINPTEYLFLQKHMDAFKRMWQDQGHMFWERFCLLFKSCAVNFGVMKDFPGKPEQYEELMEEAFILISHQFIYGKFGKAKALIQDIVMVAQNRHLLQHLESKSFSKDPFFLKETRDSYRNLFGPPDMKASYLKVYILFPLYTRFGGAVCLCLRRWLTAPNMDPSDESYWVKPYSTAVVPAAEQTQSSPEFNLYLQEKQNGSPQGPSYVQFWVFGDPRFSDRENPLYNAKADPQSDWRDGLDYENYKIFLDYVDKQYNPAKHKNGVDDVKVITKKKILEERLWDGQDLKKLNVEFTKSCHLHDSEEVYQGSIVWYSERELIPECSCCCCCYLENHDNLQDPYVGRMRTDSELSIVIFYTMCTYHKDFMRIEIPVDLAKYRTYPEQPLCEVEMELSNTEKTELIRYITCTVDDGIPATPITLDPSPEIELPLYIMITVQYCDGHGLNIKCNMKEMTVRSTALCLGFAGLNCHEDAVLLCVAVMETSQSFLAGLPFLDQAAHCIYHNHHENKTRVEVARQRLRRKINERHSPVPKNSKHNDVKTLVDIFREKISQGFPNAVSPKAQQKAFPTKAELHQLLIKSLDKLQRQGEDSSFIKVMQERVEKEKIFERALEEAMRQTKASVTTELGFPADRSSRYKVLHNTPDSSSMRVYFNTSLGPRYVHIRFVAKEDCVERQQHKCPHNMGNCDNHSVFHLKHKCKKPAMKAPVNNHNGVKEIYSSKESHVQESLRVDKDSMWKPVDQQVDRGASGDRLSQGDRSMSSSPPLSTKSTSSQPSSVSPIKSRKLRKCHYCQITEPAPKTYKKCLRCKSEDIKNARFYCGKECQVADWKAVHKSEHKYNELEKKTRKN